MPKHDSRVRQPASMLAFMLKAWTCLIRTAAPVLLTAFLVFPESSWACRPRIKSIEDYGYRCTQSTAAFIGTVIDIQSAKPSPNAIWRITLKVEQDFLTGQRGGTVVMQSQQRDNPYPVLGNCRMSTYLDAGMGERWLVLGIRDGGIIFPDTELSQQVPATGLDATLLKRLSNLGGAEVVETNQKFCVRGQES